MQYRDVHPHVSQRVTGAEAQGFSNVTLCFFCATDKYLAKSDCGIGAGEISIQLQRIFAFGDALRGAPGEHVGKSQPHMAKRVVRRRRQGFGQLRLGRREGRSGIGHKRKCAREHVRACRSNERVDIVGIGGQGAIEKAARALSHCEIKIVMRCPPESFQAAATASRHVVIAAARSTRCD